MKITERSNVSSTDPAAAGNPGPTNDELGPEAAPPVGDPGGGSFGVGGEFGVHCWLAKPLEVALGPDPEPGVKPAPGPPLGGQPAGGGP